MALSSFTALFNIAGGINYHLKARQFSNTLWTPFRLTVQLWLKNWIPPERELIVVGTSAGYNLDLEWVSRFEKIIGLEPDPLARWLLQRRLNAQGKGRAIEWIPSPLLQHSEMAVTQLLAKYPNAAILFNNVLGQVAFLDEERLPSLSLDLASALTGRSWASYHDRLSTNLSGNRRVRPNPDPEPQKTACSNEELANHYFARSGIAPKGITCVDHLTDQLLPGTKHYEYTLWELTPRQFHVIEFTCS